MLILLTGWEKEDTMNAAACCEGEELLYCEELCLFATEDKAEPEDPEPLWYISEFAGGP